MIKDRLDNAELYCSLSKNLKIGFEWLKSVDLKSIESGKYYIDGEKVYANVQEYETKTNAKYEVHRKYIDIQYMIQGEELVGVCDIKTCSTCVEYDDSADIEFLECSNNDCWQIISKGEFLVLFPTDAHKPAMSVDSPKTVKKVVVKVALE